MTTDDRIAPERLPRRTASAAMRAWVADPALSDDFMARTLDRRRAQREAADVATEAEAAAQARPRKGQRAADALRAFAAPSTTPPDDAA